VSDELDDWWARVAATLAAAAERVETLAARVAEAWTDDHGRERVERLAALQRTLHEEAGAARQNSERQRDDPGTSTLYLRIPGLMAPGRSADQRPGVRLPGIDADRADDEPGMRLPGD
jgi:hypothetical protein